MELHNAQVKSCFGHGVHLSCFFFFGHVFVIIPRHVDRRPSLPGAFRRATRASSMAIFWEGKCVMQAGRVGDFFVS